MATQVVQERHLWMDLAEMKDADKVCFLNAPISQVGLFSDTVEDFAKQFSAIQKQTEAIKHILSWHDSATLPPSCHAVAPSLLVTEGVPLRLHQLRGDRSHPVKAALRHEAQGWRELL